MSSLTLDAVHGIIADVQPFTMVPVEGLKFAIFHTAAVIAAGVPGHIVECGVWKGGCSLAMLLAQCRAFGKVVRTVHLLDSFQGLPPPDQRDGPAAMAWSKNTKAKDYYNNCLANQNEVKAALEAASFRPGDYRVWPGWFNLTTPLVAADLRSSGISLLRLDGDWYRSTVICLHWLLPIVSKRGMVIIDDYYAWDGCARALHEHLALHDLPYRIKSLPGDCGAYFVKE